jgi:hypothetical protein
MDLAAGDKIFFYARMDGCNRTTHVVVSFVTDDGQPTSQQIWGIDDSFLPPNTWSRFESDASALQLAGKRITGIVLTNYGGRVSYTHIGRKPGCDTITQETTTFPATDQPWFGGSLPENASSVNLSWQPARTLNGVGSFTAADGGTAEHQEVQVVSLPLLLIGPDDKIVFYARMDACNPTTHINVSFLTDDLQPTAQQIWGIDDSIMPANTWSRFEVSGAALNLAGKRLSAIILTNYGGRVSYTHIAKAALSCEMATASAIGIPFTDAAWLEDDFALGSPTTGTWDPDQHTSGTAALTSTSINVAGVNSVSALNLANPEVPFSIQNMRSGDVLVTYALIDSCWPMPQYLKLTWSTTAGDRSAVWGNTWDYDHGSAINMGPLPAAGTWVRLAVTVDQLGLAGGELHHFEASWFGGRVWLDHIGQSCEPNAAAPETLTPATQVWIEDSTQDGGVLGGTGNAQFVLYPVASGSRSLLLDGGGQQLVESLGGETLSPGSDGLFGFYMLTAECTTPPEVVVSWRNALTGEWKSAFWGTDVLYGHGTTGEDGFVAMGPMPAANQWNYLEVDPVELGTGTAPIDGLRLEISGGRVWFDRFDAHSSACRTNLGTVAPLGSTPADEVNFFDDKELEGSATFSGPWQWDSTQHATGSWSFHTGAAYGPHEAGFTNASPGMHLSNDERVVVWVLVSPCDPPREIIFGSNGHYAFLGEDLMHLDSEDRSELDAELPAPGVWTRIAIPASYFDLENATLTDMSFGVYNGKVWFDRVGRSDPFAKLSVYPTQQQDLTAGEPLFVTLGANTMGPQPIQYRFRLRRLASNATQTLQDYSTDSSVYWTPTANDAGTWAMIFEVRNHGSSFDFEDMRTWTVHVVNPDCPAPSASAPNDFQANDQVWIDDSFPASAIVDAPGVVWDTTQKASGTQSFALSGAPPANASSLETAVHAITPQYPLSAGDKLVAYVLVDPCAPPLQIVLGWNTPIGHVAAWWGDSNLAATTGVHIGAMPPAGVWTRLEVPVETLGLAGANASGVTIEHFDGRAWFDRFGTNTP